MVDRAPPPRAFFVHLQKTGGTSVLRRLKQVYAAEEIYPTEGSDQHRVFEKTVVRDLLDLSDEARQRFRLFAPHHPAWVVDVVAPDAVSFTVVREPVSRTISHLRRMSETMRVELEALWWDTDVRRTLTDYQTQFLCDPAPEEPSAPSSSLPLDRAAVEKAVSLQVATGVTHPRPMQQTHVDQAVDRLADLTVVGVTDDLVSFLKTLSTTLGLDLGAPPRANVGPMGSAIADDLLESIRQHTLFDRMLYEHASTLASVG